MDLYFQHLTDQIVAAYQDKDKDSLERFNDLTSQAATEMPLDEWKELCVMLGYDFDSDAWQS